MSSSPHHPADPRIFDISGRKLRLDTRADVDTHLAGLDVERVEEIYLAENTIGVDAARALGDLLARTKKLRVAGLSDIFISRTIDEIPAALTALCEALRGHPTLVELNLNNNALGGRSTHPLVPLLTHTPLQVLKLNNCGLGPEGGAEVAAALLAATQDGRASALRVLVVGRNRLQDGSARAWGAALAAHTHLQKVKLANNGIREAGVAAVLAGLAACADLRHLNLRDNNAVDVDNAGDPARGGAAVAALLRSAPRLEFLDLSDSGLGRAGVLALVRALPGARALRRLLLENCDMDEGVYEALAGALPPRLATLGLAANEELECAAVEGIVEVLEARGGRVVLDDDEDEEDLQDNELDQAKETVFLAGGPADAEEPVKEDEEESVGAEKTGVQPEQEGVQPAVDVDDLVAGLEALKVKDAGDA